VAYWLHLHSWKRLLLKVKRKKIIAGLVGLLVVVGGLYLLRPRSLESEAATLMSCVIDENVQCVEHYVDSGDFGAYNLNRDKIRVLLSRFKQSLRYDSGGLEVAKQPNATMVVAQAPFVSITNGKQVTLGFIVSNTAEGVKSPQFVTQLLLALSVANSPTSVSGGISKLEAWERFAREKGPEWTKAGFPGILRDPDEGLISWVDWERTCSERIRKAQNSVSGI